MNFFNITDEQFFDKNIIKVFDGIAGSAKSSNVDKIFKDYNIDYLRCTSTNKLKRDAFERYGGNCDTIAGALFKTEDNIFFKEEKESDFVNVVIDEILQTDSRVFKWINSHVGKNNIIICTDTEQLLSPGCGEHMLEVFQEFIKQDDVLYTRLSKTYRPRDKASEDYYNRCYTTTDFNLFKADCCRFQFMRFEDLVYNHNDVFICHTNDIEEHLYNVFDIYDDYNADLIQKGCISKKNVKDARKYPILPQNKINKQICAYFQPSNIASATRYQGSEVTEDQTLYFLIEKYSYVSNREWYTVVTRCYNVKNLILVEVTLPKVKTLETYFDKPIKDYKVYSMQGDNKILDKLIEGNHDKTIELDTDNYNIVKSVIEAMPEYEYEKDYFFYKGRKIITQDLRDPKVIEKERLQREKDKKKPKIHTLINKEPRLELSNYDLECFYRRLDDIYQERKEILAGTYKWQGETQAPVYFADTSESKDTLEYGIDLYSSYPHFLNYAKIPVSGFHAENVRNSEDVIKWYLILCDEYPIGSIVTEELKEEIEKTKFHVWSEFIYIGYTKAQRGSKTGAFLLDKAFKNEDTKKEIKKLHYGLLERKYLDIGENDALEHDVKYYVRNRQNRTQLLMYAIKGEQLRLMLWIKRLIYGNNRDIRGLINCDCLYFNYKSDVVELGKLLDGLIKPYKFRIFRQSGKDKEVLYKNYPDLLTKEEYKRKLERERKQKKRAEIGAITRGILCQNSI